MARQASEFRRVQRPIAESLIRPIFQIPKSLGFSTLEIIRDQASSTRTASQNDGWGTIKTYTVTPEIKRMGALIGINIDYDAQANVFASETRVTLNNVVPTPASYVSATTTLNFGFYFPIRQGRQIQTIRIQMQYTAGGASTDVQTINNVTIIGRFA